MVNCKKKCVCSHTVLKPLFTQMTKNVFSHLALVLSSHTDCFCFICSDFWNICLCYLFLNPSAAEVNVISFCDAHSIVKRVPCLSRVSVVGFPVRVTLLWTLFTGTTFYWSPCEDGRWCLCRLHKMTGTLFLERQGESFKCNFFFMLFIHLSDQKQTCVKPMQCDTLNNNQGSPVWLTDQMAEH